MSKWIVDIHGDIEGDYEIIKKYEEPKTDILDKIRGEIRKEMIESGKSNVKEYGVDDKYNKYEQCFLAGVYRCLNIIDKYKAESEE